MVFPGQHRPTARVILHNARGEVFMLLTHFDPEVGLPPRWLTPGGGIDEGESVIQAALRELAEETGLSVSAEELQGPVWQATGRWDWSDGNFHTYTDTFFQLKVEGLSLDDSGWTKDEHRDVVEYRWWNPQDLLESGESVAPHGLVEFLAGHRF
jgi:8-oxo-dGTP pyrophosphatase MutT (NUDIX family)